MKIQVLRSTKMLGREGRDECNIRTIVQNIPTKEEIS
jgi:predicted RNA-binding protein YlqC (UPF0109 family)